MLGTAAAVLSTALGLGWLLSRATTQVVNWFVMTDELFYERLAISVAQTGSLLPRLHGEVISNVNQLYPVLISTVYGNGDVPASLVAAHRLNAYVMASAMIPVYLLARQTGIGRLAGLWVGALAVAVPWIVLSSFLLTEVVAYPMFCWAVLAVTWATARRSELVDVLALTAIALSVLARTQFLLLVVVFALAVVGDALLEEAGRGSRGRELARRVATRLARTRRALVAATLAGILVLVGAAATGGVSRLLGSYAVTAEGIRLDLDLLQLAGEHVAVLALGTAILPFLLGVAWLLDRLRPSAPVAERALALVAVPTLVLFTFQVASFDQRFGAGLVKDRYLFYVLPVVLVALAGAVVSPRWPRWWTLVVPAVVCAIGFATVGLPTYEKLNVDSPLAMLNDELLRHATSIGWAHALLVLATAVAAGLLLEATVVLPRRAVAGAAAALATLALPGGAVYAFDRLFAVDGTNGLPITLDQGGVFNWIDRSVGADGRVAMVRSAAADADYWAGVAYWWDVEFWNESVVEDAVLGAGLPGPEPWLREFDERTGAALRPDDARYVLVHGRDVRFRPAGAQVIFDRGAYLFDAERPRRAAWVTVGIYGDGWTRPHTPAGIRVFAEPGQRTPLQRFLTISLASPDRADDRPVTISSNLERWEGAIPPETAVDRVATVCVAPGGFATVEIETPIVSAVHRDPTRAALTGEIDRPAGVLLRSVALADEVEPLERCPAAGGG